MSHDEETALRDRVRDAMDIALRAHARAQHVTSSKVKITDACLDAMVVAATRACFPELAE